MSIHDDLREVMGMLGKATDVRWLACERGFGDSDLWFDPYEDWCSYEDKLVRGAFKDADAQAIAAAVNFLRTHGPALLARQEAEDRLRDLHRAIRLVYGCVPNLPIDESTMDAATDALHNFCLMVGIHEVDVDSRIDEAARSGGGG